MAFQNVIWVSLINTTAQPDSNDLSKTGGILGAYDADAISQQQIAAAGEGNGIKWASISSEEGGFGVGLSADNPNTHWNTIDYCIFGWGGDILPPKIYENGVLKFTFTFLPDASAIYSILVNDLGEIEYWAGATLVYTSLNLPSYPLFADCSLEAYGWRIKNAQIETGVSPPPPKIDHLMMMKLH